METITAIHRNHYGDIISFVTSSGRIISYQKALIEAENGDLSGLAIEEDPEGKPFLAPQSIQSFDDYPNLF